MWLNTPKCRLMKLISKVKEWKIFALHWFFSFMIAKWITAFLQSWNSSRRTIKQMQFTLKDLQQKDIFKLPSLFYVLSFWVISFTMFCEASRPIFHCPQTEDRRARGTLHISDYLGVCLNRGENEADTRNPVLKWNCETPKRVFTPCWKEYQSLKSFSYSNCVKICNLRWNTPVIFLRSVFQLLSPWQTTGMF